MEVFETADLKQAEKAGRRYLYECEARAEQGLAAISKTFTAVIDAYVRLREKERAQGRTSMGMVRQIERVVKFWREYAGKKAIENVDDKVLREFIPWRRD